MVIHNFKCPVFVSVENSTIQECGWTIVNYCGKTKSDCKMTSNNSKWKMTLKSRIEDDLRNLYKGNLRVWRVCNMERNNDLNKFKWKITFKMKIGK